MLYHEIMNNLSFTQPSTTYILHKLCTEFFFHHITALHKLTHTCLDFSFLLCHCVNKILYIFFLLSSLFIPLEILSLDIKYLLCCDDDDKKVIETRKIFSSSSIQPQGNSINAHIFPDNLCKKIYGKKSWTLNHQWAVITVSKAWTKGKFIEHNLLKKILFFFCSSGIWCLRKK